MTLLKGKIQQVIGVVVDVEFTEQLPEIYNALSIKSGDNDRVLTLEVAHHLTGRTVRAIALRTTDGTMRGQEVVDTGQPIADPTGNDTLGRMFNVTGEPIDGTENNFTERMPIHRPSPQFDEQNTQTENFETGIKVIDLIAP